MQGTDARPSNDNDGACILPQTTKHYNTTERKDGSSITLSCTSEVSTQDEGSSGLPYPPCSPAGWRWALLDGPVDSDWIENLNSVLDDSKILCLSNGERINLRSGSRILFETDDLTEASPATISRCGVLYVVKYVVVVVVVVARD